MWLIQSHLIEPLNPISGRNWGEISCLMLSRQFKQRRAKVLFFLKDIEKCTENCNFPADQQVLTCISLWSCDQHTHEKKKKERKENSFVHIFLIVLVLYSWNRFWVCDKNYQMLLIILKNSYVLKPSHVYPWLSLRDVGTWHTEMEPGTQRWITQLPGSLSLKATTSDRLLSKFIKLQCKKIKKKKKKDWILDSFKKAILKPTNCSDFWSKLWDSEINFGTEPSQNREFVSSRKLTQ